MNLHDALGSETKKARVEIIPLIDVIFFLLATFVLFTLSLNKIKSLDLTLPVGGPGKNCDDTLYLQAAEAGSFYIKIGDLTAPDLISATEIPSRLADYQRRTQLPRVLIRGDNHAKFGGTVLALDSVRKAGITQVSVETLVSPTGR